MSWTTFTQILLFALILIPYTSFWIGVGFGSMIRTLSQAGKSVKPSPEGITDIGGKGRWQGFR